MRRESVIFISKITDSAVPSGNAFLIKIEDFNQKIVLIRKQYRGWLCTEPLGLEGRIVDVDLSLVRWEDLKKPVISFTENRRI